MKIRNYLLCTFLLLAACGKKDNSPATGAKPAIDTTEKAEPVAIADTNHHLFFRPHAGSVRQYHVIDRMTASATDAQPNGQTTKRAATSENEFYLTEKVGTTNSDSSVSLTFRIDSIRLSTDEDTTHTRYSSNNTKDRANDQFQRFNIVIGKSVQAQTNKFGDLTGISDISSVTNALLTQVPDSLRSNPRIKQMATQRAEQIVSDYIMRILVHSPTRALIKDTAWRNTSDVNLDVAPGLAFPVSVNATETVRGLERRGERVLAVLEDNTTTTPKKRVFQEGPAKATVNNFVATSHSVARIDDATGVLFHRGLEEKRSFTFVVENSQNPGGKRTVSQNGSETLTVEMISEVSAPKP